MAILGSILSEFILVVLIFLILYIVFALGKLLFGLLVNLVLGFVSIYLLNLLFGLGIRFDLIVIVIVAIFGLPGAAVVVLLKLIGIAL